MEKSEKVPDGIVIQCRSLLSIGYHRIDRRLLLTCTYLKKLVLDKFTDYPMAAIGKTNHVQTLGQFFECQIIIE